MCGYCLVVVMTSLVWLHIASYPIVQDRRSKLFLCWIVLFLSANIYFVYYVFREQQLENWWVWLYCCGLIGLNIDLFVVCSSVRHFYHWTCGMCYGVYVLLVSVSVCVFVFCVYSVFVCYSVCILLVCPSVGLYMCVCCLYVYPFVCLRAYVFLSVHVSICVIVCMFAYVCVHLCFTLVFQCVCVCTHWLLQKFKCFGVTFQGWLMCMYK